MSLNGLPIKLTYQQPQEKENKMADRVLPKKVIHYQAERTMISVKEYEHSWRLNPKRFSNRKRFIRV